MQVDYAQTYPDHDKVLRVALEDGTTRYYRPVEPSFPHAYYDIPCIVVSYFDRVRLDTVPHPIKLSADSYTGRAAFMFDGCIQIEYDEPRRHPLYDEAMRVGIEPLYKVWYWDKSLTNNDIDE